MYSQKVATIAEISSAVAVEFRSKILQPQSFAYHHSVNQSVDDFSELHPIVESMNNKINAKRRYLQTWMGQTAPEYHDLESGEGVDSVVTDCQIQPQDFISMIPNRDQGYESLLTTAKKLCFVRHVMNMELEQDSRMDYASIWGDSDTAETSEP